MTGRYKAYSVYKDSGEWLGNVPEQWVVLGLGKVVEFMSNGCSSMQIERSDETVGVTRIETISSGLVNEDKIGYVQSRDILVRFLLKKDDIQFSNINSLSMVGNCAIFNSDALLYAGMNLLHIRPKLDRVHPRFMFYQFKAKWFRNKVEAYAKPAINQASIPTGSLRLFEFLCPTIDEQTQIANFLDYETAKIDTLIEKQQQLIKLLKEKRQAVISHAVTKGLNPDAPMKDSGVEWLGDAPEHWKVKRFKNIFQIKKRIAGKLGYDILSITQKGIKIKDIESGEGQLSMDYSKYQLVYRDDFAMNHMDLLTGFVDISKYEGVTSPDYRVFTLVDKSSFQDYFLYFLQMGYINKLFFPFGQGAAHIGRWRLPTEAFNEFLAPCPPETEQMEIATFIKASLGKMTELEERAIKAIALMQERRTALISAAVTGKIDVCNWKPPEQNQTIKKDAL